MRRVEVARADMAGADRIVRVDIMVMNFPWPCPRWWAVGR